MFSCKSRYACGKNQHSDSDDDSSYGFKVAGNRGNRTRAVLVGDGLLEPFDDNPDDYHIYGNVTFGYKPILKTRLSSAASSMRMRRPRPPVKRTVSFSGVKPSTPPDVRRRSLRPPPPSYSVAVRRAASFSATRRNAAEIVAQRQRMPLPHENVTAIPPPLPPCNNVSRVVVDVHKSNDYSTAETDLERPLPPPPAFAFPVSIHYMTYGSTFP